jgi:hypothetical protein
MTAVGSLVAIDTLPQLPHVCFASNSYRIGGARDLRPSARSAPAMGRVSRLVDDVACGTATPATAQHGIQNGGILHRQVCRLRDRRRALRDQQSLTAAFFGDPLPGMSALDQRRNERAH